MVKALKNWWHCNDAQWNWNAMVVGLAYMPAKRSKGDPLQQRARLAVFIGPLWLHVGLPVFMP